MEKMIFLDFEQMKIISDPNKMEILNCFEDERALTVTEISQKLKNPYSNVNYHIKVLEKNGILQVVDTKIKSGIIEKYYMPVAEEFRMDKSISIYDCDVERPVDKNDQRYRDFYNNYVALRDSLEGNDSKDAILRNSIIFLSEKQLDEIKKQIDGYITELLEKYGKQRDNSQSYSVGSFVIPKKRYPTNLA